MLASRLRSILRKILTQPTAPFHEHRVRAALCETLKRSRVPWRIDAHGNLLAHYRKGRARPLALTAHMDHPGFELVSVEGRKARALWNGQVPTFDLRGLRLALWSDRPQGRLGAAVVEDGDGRRPQPQVKDLRISVPPGARAGDFGYADLTPFRLSRGRIVSKALDNVAGCAAIAACLDHLSRNGLPGDVVGLFTRAEEVGFHGALGAIQAGSLPRGRPVVVLECSKALPGAEQGKGPVIRVGDKARIFDPDLLAACEESARALQKKLPRFKFQRRLMDGGTCEATAFGLAGYQAVCLAFPLGNYHNVGSGGVLPENISEEDFLNGVRLLAHFASSGLDSTLR